MLSRLLPHSMQSRVHAVRAPHNICALINRTDFHIPLEPFSLLSSLDWKIQSRAMVTTRSLSDFSHGAPQTPAPKRVRANAFSMMMGAPKSSPHYTYIQGDLEESSINLESWAQLFKRLLSEQEWLLPQPGKEAWARVFELKTIQATQANVIAPLTTSGAANFKIKLAALHALIDIATEAAFWSSRCGPGSCSSQQSTLLSDR